MKSQNCHTKKKMVEKDGLSIQVERYKASLYR